MKKKLLLVLFSLSIIFCFPKLTDATVMEVTFTVLSLTIPERAIILGKQLNTEFLLQETRIVAMVGTSTKAIKYFPKNNNGDVQAGESAIITFPYSPGTSYDLHLEIRGYNQGNNITCTAKCDAIPANSNQCVTRNAVYYKDYTPSSSTMCPFTTCPGSYYGNRFSFPGGCFGYNDYNTIKTGTTYYFWRSPTIFTIN